MGLITGLLTLPLAPVRGTVWLGERILEQAESETGEEAAIRDEFAALHAAREAGVLSEEEAYEAENELIERLVSVRGFGKG
ncbi:MAG TPA: gas vesicle protein GvpG [Thermoleophilaceae bacterium]|nr:gas vesicle protein GvpG [Thermoleophilaceae bacterium]